MNKNLIFIVLAVVIVALGIFDFVGSHANPGGGQPVEQPATTSTTGTPNTTSTTTFDPLNATYMIDGTQPATLVNGLSIVTTPGIKEPSATMVMTTKVFGEPVFGDLNGDGTLDAALFVTYDTGGSGTFYYVVAAINTGDGTQGTNAIFLGDRIAPQTMEIKNGKIIVNYAEQKAGEGLAGPPSVGVTRYLTVQSSTLLAENAIVGAGGECGGNMTTAPTCQTGYHCAAVPGSHLPVGDVGGICVAN